MALYRQLKFPSTFIEYRSVSEWKGVIVISNFDSFQIYRPRKLPSLPRPKFAPANRAPMEGDARLHSLFSTRPTGSPAREPSLHVPLKAPTERDPPPLEPLSTIPQSPR